MKIRGYPLLGIGRKEKQSLRLHVLAAGLLGALNVSAVPQISVTYNAPNLLLSWNSFPGNVYQVQARDGLTTGSWTTVDTLVSEDYVTTWLEWSPLVNSRFYRLLLPNGEHSLLEPPEKAP